MDNDGHASIVTTRPRILSFFFFIVTNLPLNLNAIKLTTQLHCKVTLYPLILLVYLKKHQLTLTDNKNYSNFRF